jgi:diaminohydroxyphosphoribosylaminopyrimidine deaminase / 5-amino-6-(5-phosphoribosylamino)uracil reductase
LRGRGAEVVVLPDAHGKVDLPALLLELGRRGINEVLGEAGFKLNGSLIRELRQVAGDLRFVARLK